MSELKTLRKCPFCGGEAELHSAFIEKVAFVSCTKCGAALPMMVEAEAVEAWNTRHEPNCDGCDAYEHDLQGWCEGCARACPDNYMPKEEPDA